MIEPIRLSFEVACPVEHAFATWTERTSTWWPASHTVTATDDVRITFEPGVGGRIFERTPTGEEHDWGEITAWEPPRRLAYLWHLRFDRSDATEVEITFEDDAAGAGTAVTIVHRGWERLGAEGPGRRERNARGWAGLLPHFEQVCAEKV